MSKLLKILGLDGEKLIDAAKDAADEFIYSKEERVGDSLREKQLMFEQELRRQELDKEVFQMEAEAYLKASELFYKDIESARNREVAITNSDNASMLQKNIMPLLAIVVVLFTFTIWTMILFRRYDPKVNEAMIIGSLTTISVTIINYYFGSSNSSAKKDASIEAFSRNK